MGCCYEPAQVAELILLNHWLSI